MKQTLRGPEKGTERNREKDRVAKRWTEGG